MKPIELTHSHHVLHTPLLSQLSSTKIQLKLFQKKTVSQIQSVSNLNSHLSLAAFLVVDLLGGADLIDAQCMLRL
jgi:hypothetical protein